MDDLIITDIPLEVKQRGGRWRRDLFVAILILLVAIIAFGLGRLSAFWERVPIHIEAQT